MALLGGNILTVALALSSTSSSAARTFGGMEGDGAGLGWLGLISCGECLPIPIWASNGLTDGLTQGSAIDPRIQGIPGIRNKIWDSFSKSGIWDWDGRVFRWLF